MITLINKNNFTDISVDESKLTIYSKNEFLIYTGTELYTVDGENLIDNFPLKYRKGVNEVITENKFNECSFLIMMNETEMNEVDTKEYNEMMNKDYFKGYKYKLTTSASVVDINSPYHSMAIIGLLEKNDSDSIYDENGNLISIVSYWNEIKSSFLTVILSDTNVFTLETNTYN